MKDPQRYGWNFFDNRVSHEDAVAEARHLFSGSMKGVKIIRDRDGRYSIYIHGGDIGLYMILKPEVA